MIIATYARHACCVLYYTVTRQFIFITNEQLNYAETTAAAVVVTSPSLAKHIYIATP